MNIITSDDVMENFVELGTTEMNKAQRIKWFLT